MELNRVIIKNFRSIKSIDLSLIQNFYVLVGKNETGKTNILNALRFLDPLTPITVQNIRESLPNEPDIEESYIYFEYYLNLDEINDLLLEIADMFTHYDFTDHIGNISNQKATLLDYISDRSKGLICIDFIKKTRSYKYWSASKKGYTINKRWKKVKDNCPLNCLMTDNSGDKIDIKQFTFIDCENFDFAVLEYCDDVVPNDFFTIIGDKIIKILQNQKNECVFWDYKEENLLPSKVILSEFKENPKSCLPLSCLFNLAGIENIKSSIDLAISKNPKSLSNLLNRVSKKVTDFFREKWTEYNDIEFDLSLNGNVIEISIKELNKFDFSQRSDGFKRFITFLIMISAKVQTDQLTKNLIIIDEPEIGLHPSGQRYLRNELLKISEKNKIVFSTHSIFLINPNNLKSHFIVKKTKESTSLMEVNESLVVDEEVVYNALGCSVFESLRQNNFIFEGYTDKIIFRTAISRIPAKDKKLNILKDYGLTHAKGVKDIKHVTSLLELANRNYFIISDSDKPAKEKQAEYKKEKYNGTWLRYDELVDDETAITAEDFVKSDYILSKLEPLRSKYNLQKIELKDLDHPKGKLFAISNWLNGVEEETKRNEIKDLKDTIFDNLHISHIEGKYFKLLNNLIKSLN